MDRLPLDLGLTVFEASATGGTPSRPAGSNAIGANLRRADEEYDFVVRPGDGRCISVAGGFYGPGLSWPEAKKTIERGRLGSAAQRLLLLLRAWGDADTPVDVVEQAAEALLAVG